MRILLVEDDKELCDAIKLQLERAGYETDCCGQGQEAFYYAAEYPYDVIILDRMLPHMDGLSVLGGLRRMNIATPVIITTALDGINDRIDGLDAGADDYLVKPEGTLQPNKRESALMEYLIRNAGQVLPSGLILSYIWGPDSDVEEGNLDNYIYFLRRRLKSIGALPQIKTVHGIGYRLENGGTHD